MSDIHLIVMNLTSKSIKGKKGMKVLYVSKSTEHIVDFCTLDYTVGYTVVRKIRKISPSSGR